MASMVSLMCTLASVCFYLVNFIHNSLLIGVLYVYRGKLSFHLSSFINFFFFIHFVMCDLMLFIFTLPRMLNTDELICSFAD